MFVRRQLKPFRWTSEINLSLKAARGISFEKVVVSVDSDGLLDTVAHPNQTKYPRQKIMVVAIENYAYLVPYVDEDDHYFLTTVIPSRKATRELVNKGEPDVET